MAHVQHTAISPRTCVPYRNRESIEIGSKAREARSVGPFTMDVEQVCRVVVGCFEQPLQARAWIASISGSLRRSEASLERRARRSHLREPWGCVSRPVGSDVSARRLLPCEFQLAPTFGERSDSKYINTKTLDRHNVRVSDLHVAHQIAGACPYGQCFRGFTRPPQTAFVGRRATGQFLHRTRIHA